MLNPHRNKTLPREASIVNIDKLRTQIHKSLPEHSGNDFNLFKFPEREVVDDFVALSLFSGNDYLPKIGTFDISRIWPKYQRARRGEIGSKKIDSISNMLEKGDHVGIGTLLSNLLPPAPDKLLLQFMFNSYLPKFRMVPKMNPTGAEMFIQNKGNEELYFSLKGKMSVNQFAANFMRLIVDIYTDIAQIHASVGIN